MIQNGVYLFLMKPITEYQEFRRYMQDFYEERKSASKFTWREFARLAGFTSPIFLKLVCDGKSNLSDLGVEKVASAMNLGGFELEYFRAMVGFGQAKDDAERKRSFGRMRDIADAHKVKILGSESFKYFESWKNPVLRELAVMMPGASSEELAEKSCNPMTAAEAKTAVDFMVSAGLLKKEGSDSYVLADASLMSSPKAMPVVIRSMHRDMASFAVNAIDDFDVDERNFSGVTMGVDREAYQQIVRELESCRRKIVAIAASSQKPDQVYRVNMQLFPLSKKIEG